MKPTDEQAEFEWIDDYLLGKLSKEEMAFFGVELNNNLDFAKKVSNVKLIHDLLKQSFVEEQVLQTIKTLQANDRQPVPKGSQMTVVKYIGGFVAAASVIFVSYLSFATIDFPNTENDFNITRGVDSTKFTTEQRSAFSSFFDGQAHLVEGRFLLAINDFENSLKVANIRPYFREAAQWHLAVAYMKSKQPQKAEKIYQTFENCEACEYPVNRLNRWKLWLQIQLSKFA